MQNQKKLTKTQMENKLRTVLKKGLLDEVEMTMKSKEMTLEEVLRTL